MSYDTVAATYARVAVPWFTPIAEDLIEAVSPQPGDVVLDVGTGTGLVAGLASLAVRPGGHVIGADPSTGMLALHRYPDVGRVAARAPGLPFADRSFDVVVANLVLSHLPDLATGMADLVRVVRLGGRFGVTAWADPVPDGPDNDLAAADEIVAEVQIACGLAVAPPPTPAVPYEDELRSRDRLAEVLKASGLVELSFALHRYARVFGTDEFLAGWGSRGRYVRHVHGHERWAAFTARAGAALDARFGDSINSINEAWVVSASRPD